jgi:hypothetical protein
MIRGGGDPNTVMASKPSAEWAGHLGASPLKRMAASWSGSDMDSTEYKVAARETRPTAGSPRINQNTLDHRRTITCNKT